MLAGKLVLSYPVWKGELSIGSEVTSTHSYGTNENEEHYVKSSDDDIRENNIAGFAEYALHLGDWSFDGGLHMLSSYVQYDNRYGVEGGNPLLRHTNRQDIDLRLNYSWLSLSCQR